MPDLKELSNDPNFRALPFEEQLKGFRESDADFASLPVEEQQKGVYEMTGALYKYTPEFNKTIQETLQPPGPVEPIPFTLKNTINTPDFSQFNIENIRKDIPTITPDVEKTLKNALILGNTFGIDLAIAYDMHDSFVTQFNEKDFWEKASNNLAAGIGSVYEMVGYGMKMAGLGSTKEYPDLAKKDYLGLDSVVDPDLAINFGKKLQMLYTPSEIEERNQKHYSLLQAMTGKKVELSNWEKYTNPEYMALHAISGLPATLSLLPPAIMGVAASAELAAGLGLGTLLTLVAETIGGSALTIPLEASQEAVGAYQTAIEHGESEEVARGRASEVFKSNLNILGATVPLEFGLSLYAPAGVLWRRMFAAGVKFALDPAIEATQERLQEWKQMEIEYGKPVNFFANNPRLNEATVMGAIYGLGYAGAGSVWSHFHREVTQELPPETQKIYDTAKEEAVMQGLTLEQSQAKGLEEVAKTPEGEAHIKQVVQDIKDRSQSLAVNEELNKRLAEIQAAENVEQPKLPTFDETLNEIASKEGEITNADIEKLLNTAPIPEEDLTQGEMSDAERIRGNEGQIQEERIIKEGRPEEGGQNLEFKAQGQPSGQGQEIKESPTAYLTYNEKDYINEVSSGKSNDEFVEPKWGAPLENKPYYVKTYNHAEGKYIITKLTPIELKGYEEMDLFIQKDIIDNDWKVTQGLQLENGVGNTPNEAITNFYKNVGKYRGEKFENTKTIEEAIKAKEQRKTIPTTQGENISGRSMGEGSGIVSEEQIKYKTLADELRAMPYDKRPEALQKLSGKELEALGKEIFVSKGSSSKEAYINKIAAAIGNKKGYEILNPKTLDEKMAGWKKEIDEKLSRPHAGIDPTVLIPMAKYGAGLLQKGITKVAEWKKEMISKFGDKIKPYLSQILAESKRIFHNEAIKEAMPVIKSVAKEAVKRGEAKGRVEGKTEEQAKAIPLIKKVAQEAYKKGKIIGAEEAVSLRNTLKSYKIALKAGKLEGIAIESQKLKNIFYRVQKIRAIRDFFHFTDTDMKKISRKNPLLMSTYEFKLYIDDVRQKAVELAENKIQKNILSQFILNKKLKNVDNYRRVLKLPPASKMTTEQLKMFIDALTPFQEDDIFLSERLLEVVDRVPEIKGVKTFREIFESMARDFKVPLEELKTVKHSEFDKYIPDAFLAQKNPIYRELVTQTLTKLMEANIEVFKVEDKVNELARKSEASRKLSLLEKAIPQDKQLVAYIEATPEMKDVLVKDMTPEQVDQAHHAMNYLANSIEYLVEIGALKKGLENYFPHNRMSFLENVKEDGLSKALSNLFRDYKWDQEVWTILDQNTGNILPVEKFFRHTLFRTGELDPSQNFVKSFMEYVRSFERMKSLNELLPKWQLYANTLTKQNFTKRGLELDTKLKRFIYEYINNKKGRRITSMGIDQGGYIDMALHSLRTFTTMNDMGFSVAPSLTTIIGEHAATFQQMGFVDMAKGIYRMNTAKGKAFIAKHEVFVGRTIWEEFTRPGQVVNETLTTALFTAFHESSRITNSEFLLGTITDEEYESGELSSRRLAELKLEMAKYRFVPGTESLVGSTEVAKAALQYKKWAIPLLISNVQNIYTLIKDVSNNKSGAWTTEQARQFYRLIGIAAPVLIIMALTRPDKDSDDYTFLGKMRKKALMEALSSVSSLDSTWWLSAPRIITYLIGIGTAIKQFVTWETYENEDLKFPETIKKQLPSAIKQFIPKSEHRKGSSIEYQD